MWGEETCWQDGQAMTLGECHPRICTPALIHWGTQPSGNQTWLAGNSTLYRWILPLRPPLIYRRFSSAIIWWIRGSPHLSAHNILAEVTPILGFSILNGINMFNALQVQVALLFFPRVWRPSLIMSRSVNDFAGTLIIPFTEPLQITKRRST